METNERREGFVHKGRIVYSLFYTFVSGGGVVTRLRLGVRLLAREHGGTLAGTKAASLYRLPTGPGGEGASRSLSVTIQ